jgi:plastocyanin
MKNIILAVVIIAIIGVGGYFIIKKVGNNSSPNPQPLTVTIYCVSTNCSAQQIAAGAGTLVQGCYRNLSDCTAGLGQSVNNMISIKNFAFNPQTLTVPVGIVVTWTNQDSAPHQIKSATFNSAVLNTGATFSFTFSQKGTFDYSCAIHPSMTGQIIVQ